MSDRSLVVVLVAVSLTGCIGLAGSLLAQRRSDWLDTFSWLLVSVGVGLAAVCRAQGRTELDPWGWWLVLLAILLHWQSATSQLSPSDHEVQQTSPAREEPRA